MSTEKINIYTYYGETNDTSGQQELIDIWLANWESKGWSPHILTKEMAKEAPLHDEYVDFVNRIHRQINENNTFKDNTYMMEAQREIVAFTLLDQPSFISDYDVFNINYQSPPPEEKVHWRDACCSCFASGGSAGWTDYIHWLFAREQQILEGCIKVYKQTNRQHFGDQDFLIFAMKGFKQALSPKTPVHIEGVPVYEYRNACSPSDPAKINDSTRTIHISHAAVERYPGYGNLTSWEKRIQIAKEVL